MQPCACCGESESLVLVGSYTLLQSSSSPRQGCSFSPLRVVRAKGVVPRAARSLRRTRRNDWHFRCTTQPLANLEVQKMIRSTNSKTTSAVVLRAIAAFWFSRQQLCSGGATFTSQHPGNGLVTGTRIRIHAAFPADDKVRGFLVGYSYSSTAGPASKATTAIRKNTLKTFGSFGQSSIRSDFHEMTGAFVAHIPLNARGVRPYAVGGAGALLFNPTDEARMANTGSTPG
jgi:hypothetical protein